MTDHTPKLYVCHETPDRSNPRATDRPAIRIDAPQGQEIAVITLTNYKVFGEDMSPEQWGAYIVKAVNNFQKLTDQITEYDTRLNEMQELNAELKAEIERLKNAEPDWWWCDLDPDDSGDSAYEAMHGYSPRLKPVHLHSSYHGPSKWGVVTLKELPKPDDSDGDGEEEAFLFDTEEDAQKFCDERKAALTKADVA